MRLQGIASLVTGGASGLGLATTRELAARGASVTILDLPSSPGAEVIETIDGDIDFVAADVTDETQVREALATVSSSRSLRALVHCAGRGSDRTRILDRNGQPGDLETFAEVIRINLIGTYNVLRTVTSAMSRNDPLDGDRGACVLTASVAAFDGQIGQTSYSAAKAGVHGMTLVAARDLARWQIRVNTIAPGVFDTPMLARHSDEVRQGLVNSVPHPKRLGQPADYAQLAVMLLENSYINGSTIRLDGAIRMAP